MGVVETVAAHDYCCGCGVCAALCPEQAIAMGWSELGELAPRREKPCLAGCRRCLDVCPMCADPSRRSERTRTLFPDALGAPDSVAGPFLSCYAGYAVPDEARLRSASGGMATLFLQGLLAGGVVDRVIAVSRGGRGDRLFDFCSVSAADALAGCAGSAYYPVELSAALEEIVSDAEERRYAVIALPCAIYGLRLAMEQHAVLRRRIVLCASLVCGQLQNRFCTEYLSLKGGVPLSDLATVDFRRKTPAGDPANFAHVPIRRDGAEGNPLPYQELPLHLAKYRYFTQNACNHCDDVFGEMADVTFMDAWLPEFSLEWRGTSLVVVRSGLARRVLQQAAGSGRCVMREIAVEKVIKSQQGVVFRKRDLLAGRIFAAQREGTPHPATRVVPSEKVYRRHRRFLSLTREIQSCSKSLWSRYRASGDLAGFEKSMERLEREIACYERGERVRALAGSLLRPLRRVLWGR